MEAMWKRVVVFLVTVVGILCSIGDVCEGGSTSSFVRNDYLSLDMPLDSDVFRVPPGYNAPQQVRNFKRFLSFLTYLFFWELTFFFGAYVWKVHITQGDHLGKGVIISWITQDEPGSSTVVYWAKDTQLKRQAHGFFVTYTYFNYTSGFIHHCTIENLEVCTCPYSHSLFIYLFLSLC